MIETLLFIRKPGIVCADARLRTNNSAIQPINEGVIRSFLPAFFLFWFDKLTVFGEVFFRYRLQVVPILLVQQMDSFGTEKYFLARRAIRLYLFSYLIQLGFTLSIGHIGCYYIVEYDVHEPYMHTPCWVRLLLLLQDGKTGIGYFFSAAFNKEQILF